MPRAADKHQTIADRAVEFITDGAVVGIGTGHAATAFIRALAPCIQAGLRVRCVPTSLASAELAGQLYIPLTTLDLAGTLDVDVDGADEVDPDCNLIKGYGGALVREKIVAAAARHLIILVGPEKLVPSLGSRGRLPVEVIPFATGPCSRALAALGCTPEPRKHNGNLFLTDNGNIILDCQIAPIARPAELEQALRAIPGVVGTGLFLNMNPTVLIQRGDHVELRGRGA